MSVRALIVAVAVAAPAAAQQAPARDPGQQLDGFARSARDALAALGALAGAWIEGLAPALAEPHAYEPPVTLPSGDILIRRKPARPDDDAAPALDL